MVRSIRLSTVIRSSRTAFRAARTAGCRDLGEEADASEVHAEDHGVVLGRQPGAAQEGAVAAESDDEIGVARRVDLLPRAVPRSLLPHVDVGAPHGVLRAPLAHRLRGGHGLGTPAVHHQTDTVHRHDRLRTVVRPPHCRPAPVRHPHRGSLLYATRATPAGRGRPARRLAVPDVRSCVVRTTAGRHRPCTARRYRTHRSARPPAGRLPGVRRPGARCAAEGAAVDVDERAGRRPAAPVRHGRHRRAFRQQDQRAVQPQLGAPLRERHDRSSTRRR